MANKVTLEYTATIQSEQCQTLLNALNKQEFVDVTFVIGEEEVEFNINRLFLSLISPVFKAMLFGQMQESKPNSNVIIKDLNPKIFESILNFAYCNNPMITSENVLSLIKECDKYQITQLLDICRRFLDSCLNPHNFCAFFHESLRLNIVEKITCHILLNYFTENYEYCLNGNNFCGIFVNVVEMQLSGYTSSCQQYLQNCGGLVINDILKSDSFMKITLSTMELLLKTEPLRCKEEELWTAVRKWAKYQSKKVDDDDDDDDKKEEMDKYNDNINDNELDLLKSVKDLMRFGFMDTKYFASVVSASNVLSKDELIAVFVYFSIPSRGCGGFSTIPRIPTPSEMLKYTLTMSSRANSDDNHDSSYAALVNHSQGFYAETQRFGNTQSIKAIFETAKRILLIVIASAAGKRRSLAQCTLQYSRDGHLWQTLTDLNVFHTKEIHNFDTDIIALAVRVYRSDKQPIAISQFKIFGW